MNGLDWAALAIIMLSALVGFKRGLVREALALAAWVIAFLVAGRAGSILGPYLPGLTAGGVRDGAAMVLAFIAVLLMAGFLTLAVRGLVRAAGLSLEDRLLGLFFGLLRGGVALVLLTLVAGLTALPQSQAWKTSRLHQPLQMMALSFMPLLPADIAGKIRFV